ncbi:unnamed protein product [Meloidogyne enterolobii]|uniref:Uncharacterized protein n=1 Tax=Meloidogyne enterolobii TaxID=390850 RepID=A0ACB1AP45_MELEN
MSMDSAAELKAAEFIQEMAERLNHNTEDIWQIWCIRLLADWCLQIMKFQRLLIILQGF